MSWPKNKIQWSQINTSTLDLRPKQVYTSQRVIVNNEVCILKQIQFYNHSWFFLFVCFVFLFMKWNLWHWSAAMSAGRTNSGYTFDLKFSWRYPRMFDQFPSMTARQLKHHKRGRKLEWRWEKMNLLWAPDWWWGLVGTWWGWTWPLQGAAAVWEENWTAAAAKVCLRLYKVGVAMRSPGFLPFISSLFKSSEYIQYPRRSSSRLWRWRVCAYRYTLTSSYLATRSQTFSIFNVFFSKLSPVL